MWILKPIQAPGLRPVQPTSDGLRLGRDDSCDVVIPGDRFPHVSGAHCRVFLDEERVVVEDLGSKNGTLVNEQKIERKVLAPGDIVQVGELGPRYLTTDSSSAVDTATVALAEKPRSAGISRLLQESAIFKVREALGIEEHVDDVVRRRTRRNQAVALVAVVLVVAGSIYGFLYLKGRSDIDKERFDTLVSELEENNQLAEQIQRDLLTQIEDARTTMVSQQERLDGYREALVKERDELSGRIQEIAAAGKTSAEELTVLRGDLARTTEQIGLFDPVSFDQQKLERVAKVRETIVLLEVDLVFREEKSNRILFLDRDPASGRVNGNLEGKGIPFKRQSTGSGFCVSKDGWILTCGHVVEPKGHDEKVSYGDKNDPLVLVPSPVIHVVFSDDEERHAAKVHDVVYDEDDDIALVKIEPFEGMPYLDRFATDPPTPPPGSDVYLFGFPLGKRVIQEGDRVIASTFRGILSRRVNDFLQIDAAVHPGNSGGPLTDRLGRVIGIVSRVQANPEDGGIVADIGYVLPISDTQKIWPPRNKS